MTPVSPRTKDDHRDIVTIARTIEEAWRSGRTIVPVIGAGLSADSGFPVLRSVVRYLAKLNALLQLPAVPIDASPAARGLLDKVKDRYYKRPRYFVTDFNWPDRFQLNQDLLALWPKSKTASSDGPEPETVSALVASQLTELAPSLNLAAFWPYDALRADVVRATQGAYSGLEAAIRDPRLRAAVDDHGAAAPGAVREYFKNIEQALGAARAAAQSVEARFGCHKGWSVPYDVYGDWRRLVQHITGHQSDYADSLFSTLGRNKRPNQGHRFLTFLVRLLSVRTVFTFNFDDLIERAFESEGIRPKVFAMEEGRTVPHGSLVSDGVSVVKLHGGTHSLLLDERLDRPLSREYLERFDRLVGPNPFLLVVGCSGGDHRLISLVDHVLEGKPGAADRVAWLHFESYPPFALLGDTARPESGPLAPRARSESEQKVKPGVLTARTTQPASALTHLYSFLTSRYPASMRPYTAGAGHALAYASRVDTPRLSNLPAVFEGTEKVFRLSTIDPEQLDEAGTKETFPAVTASEALLDVAHYGLSRGYTPILVNLESVHTLAGLVGAVVDQCRQYDTALVPSVLPAERAEPGAGDDSKDSDARVVSKAVALVANALQRSRYVVLLDGLETYIWNATSHHGETTTPRVDLDYRFRLLCNFICRFREAQGDEPANREEPAGGRRRSRINDIGESRIVIGLDPRAPRNDTRGRDPVKLGATLKDQHFGDLPAIAWADSVTAAEGGPRFSDIFEPLDGGMPFLKLAPPASPAGEPSRERDACDALGLLLLAACRRPRPLALVRHLLRPVFQDPDKIDGFVKRLTDNASSGFVALEGGVTWVSRPVRDHLYTVGTKYVSTESMREILEGGNREHLESCVIQLVNIYAMHFRISRTYYVYTFTQSTDALAFMEYTYHRVSTLRYLAKLITVLAQAAGSSALSLRVRVAIRRLGDLWNAVDAQQDKGLLLRFQIRKHMQLYRALHEPLGPGGDHTEPVWALVAELTERHAKEARALLRAWLRHEPLLRMQLPAQQLLHWCDRLIEDDLKVRCDRVVIGYETDGTPWCWSERVVASPAVGELVTVLKSLRVKLLAERGDYEMVVAQRYAHIFGTEPEVSLTPARLRVMIAHITAACSAPLSSDELHYVLDIVNALINGPSLASSDQVEGLLDAFDATQLAPAVRAGRPDDACRHEAALRYFHLRAEFHLQAISVFATGFTGQPRCRGSGGLEQVLDIVDRGLDENRLQLQSRMYVPRSVIVDRGPDGTLYSQYSTVFDCLRARAYWQSEIEEAPPEKYARPEWDETARLLFQTAFRYFEVASGGLQGTNPLLLAHVEMYRAEACLGIARFQIHRAQESVRAGGDLDRVRVLFDEARAKHETARGSLKRASGHLLETRRNVIWWRLFFTLVAQYQADRLMLVYLDLLRLQVEGSSAARQWLRKFLDGNHVLLYKVLDNSATSEEHQALHAAMRPHPETDRSATSRKLPDAVNRLRAGYNAIRNAAEFRLATTPADPWLERVEREITLIGAGVAFAAIGWAESEPRKDAGAGSASGEPGTHAPAPEPGAPAKLDSAEALKFTVLVLTTLQRLERLDADTAARWTPIIRTAPGLTLVSELQKRQVKFSADPTVGGMFELRDFILEGAVPAN